MLQSKPNDVKIYFPEVGGRHTPCYITKEPSIWGIRYSIYTDSGVELGYIGYDSHLYTYLKGSQIQIEQANRNVDTTTRQGLRQAVRLAYLIRQQNYA